MEETLFIKKLCSFYKPQILGVACLFIFSQFTAAAEKLTYSNAEQTAPPKTQWNLFLDLGAGNSSNIARFEGSPEADFTQIDQSFDITSNVTESLQLYMKQSLFARFFDLPDVEEDFKNNFLNGEIGAVTNIAPHWDIGFAGIGETYQGREVDFRNNQTVGLDYQTYTVGGAAFLRRYGKTSFTELKIRRESLRALTDTFDELGNRFKNSHNAIETGIKVTDNITERWAWEASYFFEFREYLERRARFENGSIPPNFDSDFLIENYHKFSASLMYSRLRLKAGLNYVEDRIFGGETRTVPYVETSLPFNVTDSLFFVPSARWETAFYDSFKGNILNDPNAVDLRRDNNYSVGVDASITAWRIQPTLSVKRNGTETNYKIFEYKENLVMGSLRSFF